MSNPFSSGGGGVSFENSVQTLFTISTLINGRIPCLPDGEVFKILLQANSEGYETDDLVIFLNDKKSITHKLLIQIKHEISFTKNNTTLKKVLSDFWKDYNNKSIFNTETDRLLIVKKNLNKKESNHLKVMFDWVNSKKSLVEFKNLLKSSNTKKEFFETFFSILKNLEANISEEQVFNFIKAIDLISYDLTDQNSTSLTNLKTIIELSKIDSITTSAEEIIGNISNYISNQNHNGASLYPTDLKNKFDYFKNIEKLAQTKAIQKLTSDSKLVLDRINDSIKSVHIKRQLIDADNLETLIQENQIIVFQGQAGVGKSAFSKQLLNATKNACIFSFVADQFLKSRLSITLSEIGIHESIDSLFSRFILFPNKIIYIDSFEKLLEGEGESFEELLLILQKNRDIKLVISCRDYALENLIFKYIDTDVFKLKRINIPKLTQDEFAVFCKRIPEIKKVLKNNELTELLRVPKYLNLGVKLINKIDQDYQKISLIEFKSNLWKYIIENSNRLRGNTFINLTVKRAKNLTLLTSVDEFDQSIITELERDDILFEKNGLFAPSHDIFEDFALIKYIDRHKSNHSKFSDFFENLGGEPALRRAFRLWIVNKIEDTEIDWINSFIISSLDSTTIAKYWQDEIITAIINSETCDKFISENELNLLNKDQLIQRFFHLLRVTGKDSEEIPIGNSWNIVINYINNNFSQLKELYPLIIRLIFDWSKIIYKRTHINDITAENVGDIVYNFINDYENQDSWLNNNSEKQDLNKLLKIFFSLSEYNPKNIQEFLNKVKNQPDNNLGYNYNKNRIKYTLSHLYSGTLTKNFPDELIEIANKYWRIDKIKLKEEERIEKEKYKNRTFPYFPRRKELPYSFGLVDEHKFDFIPASAFNTFVYKLISHNPVKGINFIVEFTNYCVENYVNSDKEEYVSSIRKNDDLIKVKFKFNDLEREIHGSSYLWSIYSGGRLVAPKLLRAIIISLERFLYELGSINSDKLDNLLLKILDFIYLHSNSVVLISVVSSICQAFPRKIKNKFLPLINLDFMKWDKERWTTEYSGHNSFSLGLPSSSVEGEIYSRERQEAYNWEFRKKYYRGLYGFIFMNQVNIKTYNDLIFERLDSIETPIDFFDKKLIFEIDSRNHKLGIVNKDGETHYQISPDYTKDEELNSFKQDNEEEYNRSNTLSTHSLWVINTYKNQDIDDSIYDDWKQNFLFLKTQDETSFDILDNYPEGTLSVLGLKFCLKKMNKEEFNFCVNTIIDISQRLYNEKSREYDFDSRDFSISTFDKSSVLSHLPIILSLKQKLKVDIIKKVKNLIFCFIRDTRSDNDPDVKNLFNAFKSKLWDIDYSFALNSFIALLHYSKLETEFPRQEYSEEEKKLIKSKETVIVNNLEKELYNDVLPPISYEKNSFFFLYKALRIFPNEKKYSFSIPFLKILFQNHFEIISDDNKEIHYSEIIIKLESNISSTLLFSDINDETTNFFNEILNNSTDDYDKRRFTENILEQFIYYIDGHNLNEKAKNNFWSYWSELYEFIKKNQYSPIFIKEYLLYTRAWKYEADNWIILENKGHQYLSNIDSLSIIKINSLLILLSGIGFKELTPRGLSILNKHLRQNPKEGVLFSYDYGEKLIERIFKKKIKVVKRDSDALDEFLWFLDLMIERGSSKAYRIRENIILYKSK